MRKLVVAALVALFVAVAAARDIQPDALLAHIKFLASDEMKGRANGTEELERAADYIAQEFKAGGLRPGGRNDSWFQPFELNAGVTIGRDNTLSIDSQGKLVRLELGTSYYPLAALATPLDDARGVLSGSRRTDAAQAPSASLDNVPLVFAGYGLTIPALGYDDYANVDVSGKAVLIFSHEPQEQDPNSRLNGTRPMPQTTLQAKAAAARNKGARVLLVVSDPTHRVDEAPYGLFKADPDAENHGIPVLRIRRDEMKPFIDAWQLDSVARMIDSDLTPRSRALTDATVDYVEHLARNRRTVRNVIAVLPGSDPARASEAIVVGAHYDHVGLGGRLSATPQRAGEIHNGADDNASGAAAIMEMARTAAEQRARFPRTLIFIAFAGEERGLLGSAHYVTDPTVPVASTIAMLNLDMVGRAAGGVDVSGLDASPSMEADLKAAMLASHGGLNVRRQGPGAGRSDDSSFIERGIPGINFFTGFHSDYHRPTDDWEKIDAAGTKQVAILALELAARLAARPDRPEFKPPSR